MTFLLAELTSLVIGIYSLVLRGKGHSMSEVKMICCRPQIEFVLVKVEVMYPQAGYFSGFS